MSEKAANLAFVETHKIPPTLLSSFSFTLPKHHQPSYLRSTTKMAWRNQGITGSNNIPLGSRRRFGGPDSTPPADDGGYNATVTVSVGSDGYKRGRSQERGQCLLKLKLAHTNCQQLNQSMVAREDARSEIVGVMPLKIKLLA